MSTLGTSVLNGAVWNSYMFLGYLANGANIFFLTNGFAQAYFLGRKNQKSMASYAIKGAAVAASIAMSFKMASWADRDLVPIIGDKMLQFFGLHVALAVPGGYLSIKPCFALLFAGASLNGYFGKRVVVAFGTAGAFLALKFLSYNDFTY